MKGRALLLFRLARQDIRHHLAQAVLLVVAIAAVTAALTLAFALNSVNSVNSSESGVNAWLVAAVLGTVFAVAALTSVPAWIEMRRSVAEMLQTETA